MIRRIIKINEVIDNGVITYEDDLGREWEEETGRKVIRYIGKDGWNCGIDENEILKASNSILDLIEIGDYVNGKKVIDKWEEPFGAFAGTIFMQLDGEDTVPTIRKIESVLTKEQFESMQYEVK